MKTRYILLIIINLMISGCRQENKKAYVSEVKNIRVTAVSPRKISVPVLAGGVITSSEEIRLSFKTGGIIKEVSVREGSRVKKGEVLATLDLSEIRSHVTQADNAYEKARRDYERAASLHRDSVVTLEQLQNAETAVNLAGSSLDIANFNLQHSRIIAPENGIILKQLAKTSELVGSGHPVFLFGSSGKNWKVRAGISDRDIVRIHSGDSASVALDAYPGVEFRGITEQVGEMAHPLTGTYEVEILLQETRYRLASGFIATVRIFPSQSLPQLIVPAESIVEADGRNGYVFIPDGEKTVKKYPVEIVAITDSGTVIKGLPERKNVVVTEGAAYLRERDTVHILP